MLRAILCAVVALAICGDVALAKGNKAAKPAIGTIKKVDPATGVLTVTVTKKKAGSSTDTDFTVADTTKVVITQDDGTTKELKGKDGLKDAAVKEGVSVQVTSDASGVTVVAVGGVYKKAKKNKN